MVPMAEDAPGEPRRGASIRDFLTDGSLAALCAELGTIGGLPIDLRDERGGLIVHDQDDPSRPWRVIDDGAPEPAGTTRVPLIAGDRPIGWLVLGPGEPTTPGVAREQLERTLGSLAQAAGELCNQELQLRNRIREVELMYRLSALLVGSADAERVVVEALDSALEVLGLDAGSLVLLGDDDPAKSPASEAGVELKASKNLSEDWLNSPMPLSRDRAFDRAVLDGSVLVVEDLLADDRVQNRDQVIREGVRGFISAGLVHRGHPIGMIRLYARTPRRFPEADQRLLRSVAEHAAVAVEQARLLTLQESERQTQRQLDVARDVQLRMLPKTDPSIPGFDIAARYIPHFSVGGDFYDIFDLNNQLAIVIGDVVGNGIAAALLMAHVRATLRTSAHDLASPDRVMAVVNKAMCRDTLPSEFATVWFGVIDPATLELTYCSAGHDPPFVVHGGSGEVTELEPGGMIVGVDPEQQYAARSYALSPGDVLVATTDGLAEAPSFSGDRFGKSRIHSAVQTALAEADGSRVSAKAIVERVLWELRQFAGLKTKLDDQTIVVVRVENSSI